MTRVLGIDPGLRVTGFGVVQVQGSHLQYVASGTIRTHAAGMALPARLKVLFDGLCEVITRHRPDVAACEVVFVNRNPQSTLLLGQARGACLTVAVSCGLTVHEYTALQLKKAIAGHGRAGKPEIQAMVQRLLQLNQAPGPDAADALALAIAHAHAARHPLAPTGSGNSGRVGWGRGRWLG